MPRGHVVALAASMVSISFVGPSRAQSPVRVEGAALVGEKLALGVSETLRMRHRELSVHWGVAGTRRAFTALYEGAADLAIASRSISERERRLAKGLGLVLREHVLALDGLAVIVHRDNPLDSLSLEQLRAIHAGEVVRWLGVGGVDLEIVVVAFPPSSGTHAELRERLAMSEEERFASDTIFVPSSSEAVDAVAARTGSLGVVSMSADRSAVKTLAVVRGIGDPVEPSVASVRDGSYPLVRQLRLYTRSYRPEPLRRFLSFLLVRGGRRFVQEAAFVALPPTSIVHRTPTRKPGRPVPQLTRVSFGFRGSRLGSRARETLRGVVREAASDASLWITGHSEPTETEDEALSIARARSVASFLEELGISSRRMTVEGAGSSEPWESNRELSGRRLNRRAEIWVLRGER